MRGRAAFVYSASTVTQSDAYRQSVNGTLLPAVMYHIFVESCDFYTPPVVDPAVNCNSLQYSQYRLDSSIQSAANMLTSLEQGGDGDVAHSFNCPPTYSGVVSR